MLLEIWRIKGARQGRYGILDPATLAPNTEADQFEQLCESHGEGRLSVEYGRAAEFIRYLGTHTHRPTDAERFNALAALGEWPETWAEQEARLRREYPDDYTEEN